VKVVFLETVEGSALRGEVKTVANGYARNFLLPRGLAAPATPALLERAETLAKLEEERQQSLDEQARQLIGKLAGETLVMAVRVGEQGRLYGSVTNADIAKQAGEMLGEELDRRRILLPEVIRQVGLYTVPIRLSRNVTADVEVAVVDAEAPEGVAAAVQMLRTLAVESQDLSEIAADASEPGNPSSNESAAADAAPSEEAAPEATEE